MTALGNLAGRFSHPNDRRADIRQVPAGAGRIAINMKPKDSPWGGGNQFVQQLEEFLLAEGHAVTYDLDDDVTVILLIEPRPFQTTRFSVQDIAEFKATHPGVSVIHRVNECDQRKATSDVDELLLSANQVADHTVFISKWLKSYFEKAWGGFRTPVSVIQNGSHDETYKPDDRLGRAGGPLRLVTHHWSNNMLKGFDYYKRIDDLIADGQLNDIELTVVGRWPEDMTWRSAKLVDPLHGADLAAELRKHDAYVTASRFEPGGMHHIEAAQCGLPVLYHTDGGGIVEMCQRYGIGFSNDEELVSAINKMRDELETYRAKARRSLPSGREMCEDYVALLAKSPFSKSHADLVKFYEQRGFGPRDFHIGGEHPRLRNTIINYLDEARARSILEIGYQSGGCSVPMIRHMNKGGEFRYVGVDSLKYHNAVDGKVISEFLAEVGVPPDRFTFAVSDAGDFVKEVDGPFDAVFIDHFKPLYKRELLTVLERDLVNQDGYIFMHDITEKASEIFQECAPLLKAHRYDVEIRADVPGGLAIARRTSGSG